MPLEPSACYTPVTFLKIKLFTAFYAESDLVLKLLSSGNKYSHVNQTFL